MDSSFKVPARHVVAGELLELSYKTAWERNRTQLFTDGEKFGISMLGDGATISKMPLINILCMAGDNPPIVAGIHDCTEHMSEGGKKDARYIAEIFDEMVERIDPGKKLGLVDAFVMDGASNVQKAAEILAISHPGSIVLHGGEHIIALAFSDFSKMGPIKVCVSCVIPFYSAYINTTIYAVYLF